MKYAIILSLLGLSQIILGFINQLSGPVLWLLVWSGLAWILAGLAYMANAAWVFGKRTDGGMNWHLVTVFFPYLFVTHLLWHLQRALTRESAHNEIAPGVWLGRRCYDAELPPGVRTVVDLTSEFAEPREVRHVRTYIYMPMLDAAAPSLTAFGILMESVSRSPEPVYVHCAKGHGRSAMVVIAALIAKGVAPSVAEAEGLVRQSRPAIKISTAQHRPAARSRSVVFARVNAGSPRPQNWGRGLSPYLPRKSHGNPFSKMSCGNDKEPNDCFKSKSVIGPHTSPHPEGSGRFVASSIRLIFETPTPPY